MFSTTQSEIIREFMRSEEIPGAAVAIISDGEIVHEGGFGVADIAREFPADEHTRWPICSLTKAFTGVAAMQLVEQGNLKLDEPVTTYIPEFRTADRSASDGMTTRMFLRHNSGLGRAGYQDRLREARDGNPYPDRKSLVMALHDAELQSRPLECWSYCNEGYVVAGHTVELLAGKPLEDVFEQDIFARVGMSETSTSFASWREAENRMAPYGRGDMGAYDSGERHGDGYSVARLPDDYRTFLSTGGIISTAHDLALFQIACSDYAESPLLTGGSLDHSQSVQYPYGDTSWGYGFGWQVSWSGSTRVVGHSGGLPGVSTYSMMVPSERVGVVVLANLGDRSLSLLAEQLLDDVRGKPLFRNSIDDPLPFTTAFELEPDALSSYSGTYSHRSGEAKVTVVDDRLQLSIPGNRGGGEHTIELRPVGPDAFLEPQLAQIVHFVRDDSKSIVRVLSGGYAYERQQIG